MEFDEYEDRELLDQAEEHDAKLLNIGVTGKMASMFLESDVGLYILNKIDADTQQSIQGLIMCDPNDSKAIQTLQNEIRIVNSIKNWLAEAIEAGELATMALNNK